MEKPKLTRQEESFCLYYAALQNPAQAALLAGWLPREALLTGLSLLGEPHIINRLAELGGGRGCQARAGLCRLAFGSIADAVRLVLSDEENQPNPDTLDLYNVSELRRVKGGGFEVKFFSRLEALDRLAALEHQDAAVQESSLLQALGQAARLAGEGEAYSHEPL